MLSWLSVKDDHAERTDRPTGDPVADLLLEGKAATVEDLLRSKETEREDDWRDIENLPPVPAVFVEVGPGEVKTADLEGPVG